MVSLFQLWKMPQEFRKMPHDFRKMPYKFDRKQQPEAAARSSPDDALWFLCSTSGRCPRSSGRCPASSTAANNSLTPPWQEQTEQTNHFDLCSHGNSEMHIIAPCFRSKQTIFLGSSAVHVLGLLCCGRTKNCCSDCVSTYN